jgi:GTP1/Obg family GTP-binding protein
MNGPMEVLIELTEHYAVEHAALRELVESLEAEMEALRRRSMASIRRQAASTAEAHDRLRTLIEAWPELFVKPRTVVIAGVRVGYMKGRGRIEIDDEAAVIERIRRLLPAEQAELLIRVRESVDRNAVADLNVADLKRLGIRIEETGDEVLIKPTDTQVDKLVAAILKEAARLESEAAA